MKITSAELNTVCGLNSKIPIHTNKEFVLCGRSNVGKSSFINAMLNRKNLAYTSNTPGKTRTINYYLINNKFYFVDVPGYGYAKASIEEQNAWSKFINKYFNTSESIEEIILLCDIRHTPNENDKMMYDFILKATGYEPIILATKVDKIKKSEIKKNVDNIKKALNTSDDITIIPFSSEDKTGVNEVWKILNV